VGRAPLIREPPERNLIIGSQYAALNAACAPTSWVYWAASTARAKERLPRFSARCYFSAISRWQWGVINAIRFFCSATYCVRRSRSVLSFCARMYFKFQISAFTLGS